MTSSLIVPISSCAISNFLSMSCKSTCVCVCVCVCACACACACVCVRERVRALVRMLIKHMLSKTVCGVTAGYVTFKSSRSEFFLIYSRLGPGAGAGAGKG